MQNFRDYYDLLGVSPQTDAAELKRAYRLLARRYHPDLNPDDKVAEEQFKRIGEAYQVLSDPERRAEYDRAREQWRTGGDRRSGVDDFGDFPDFDDFVEDLLGRDRRETDGQGSRRAASSDWDEPQERGNGARYRSAPREEEQEWVISAELARRGGSQRLERPDGSLLEVDLPPGVREGQRLRLRGQAEGGGDLYLRLRVGSRTATGTGLDLHTTVAVTAVEAALGGSIEVDTADGRVSMTLPAGVRSGQRLRLAGKGRSDARGQRGDQIVEIRILVPPQLSDRERRLYEKLRAIETFRPRQEAAPVDA